MASNDKSSSTRRVTERESAGIGSNAPLPREAVRADTDALVSPSPEMKLKEPDLQFVKIRVSEPRPLRTTTYMPGRVYRVSTKTADELGEIVMDRLDVR